MSQAQQPSDPTFRAYSAQRSSYVNQINFGPEVDLIASPGAQS
ncbi:hypothetical protein FOMA001_g4996 [Fusarium oxysporum f. sp. matthiolae]|nr:hypothetical protein FOMA001_g4996 [Fusarium oxysporum f. sp. matthiolae]